MIASVIWVVVAAPWSIVVSIAGLGENQVDESDGVAVVVLGSGGEQADATP